MQLIELKSTVLSIPGITTEWVRSNFGDLRRRDTWEAALDRCSEFIAAAVDAAPVVIEQVTEAAQIAYAVFTPIAWGILWFACLCYHAGQAVADWWHTAPATATDTTDLVLARFRDSRLSSVVPIGYLWRCSNLY
jgi:hypothetical protein